MVKKTGNIREEYTPPPVSPTEYAIVIATLVIIGAAVLRLCGVL